jgi:DNA-binding NarL/FixJ family response regulator
MSAPRKARVMLVEDHIAFRQSLALLLSREPDLEVVAEAGSLAQARQMLDSRLDVAVLDLGLPDGDGRELIGELRRRNAGISILVLSVMLGPSHLEEVLKAGADAVLHKVASPLQSSRRLGAWLADEPPPSARRPRLLVSESCLLQPTFREFPFHALR